MLRRVIFTLMIMLCGFNSAQACQGPIFEFTILFDHPPRSSKNAEFVGEVKLHRKKNWGFFKHDTSHGFRAYVIQSTTHPNLVGKYVDIPPILETSCGPYVEAGSKGFIFGEIVSSESAEFSVLPEMMSWNQYMKEVDPQKR